MATPTFLNAAPGDDQTSVTTTAAIEELTIADGRVEPANFDRYPLLTMADAPAIEVVLLEAGDGKPRGVGEPAIGLLIAQSLATKCMTSSSDLPFAPRPSLEAQPNPRYTTG